MVWSTIWRPRIRKMLTALSQIITTFLTSHLMSDPLFCISVNILFLVYKCYFHQFTNKLRTSALPKLFFATLTAKLRNRKGVFWTNLGFLNVTRISQRPFPAGIRGHSSPGQSLLSLSMRVVEVVCGPASVGTLVQTLLPGGRSSWK